MLLSQAAIDGVTCALTVKDHQDAHLPVPFFSVCVYVVVAVGTCVCVQDSTHICAHVCGGQMTTSGFILRNTIRLLRHLFYICLGAHHQAKQEGYSGDPLISPP